MQKFCQFKDPQYGTLINLLDNYIPLVLSIYSISFKLNHFSEYFCAIIRIWIMFNDVITIRHLLFGSTCVYTGKSIRLIFINSSKIKLLSLMNIQLKIHTVFCEHKQSPQTLLKNYAKKQKLFFSQRKNSLTLDLSSHHLNNFRCLTISFNFLKLNVLKYSWICLKKLHRPQERVLFLHAEARELVM